MFRRRVWRLTVGWRFAGECGVWVAFALPKRHPLEALRHKGLRRVWHVWRFNWGSIHHQEVAVAVRSIIFLFLFSDQGQKQTPQTPHMPQSLTGQGFRGWRFVCPNATHATQTPPARRTNKQSRLIHRAGSSPPVATTATVYLPNPIEDTIIGCYYGHITIALNTIELQSKYW